MSGKGVATLIVNPAAGRARSLQSQLPAIEELLGRHGYTLEWHYTTAAPQSGCELARQSTASALILACGGDGTVHDVLQGVAHTGMALGVLPLGTANALARNLHLPMDPLAALRRLLSYTPQTLYRRPNQAGRESCAGPRSNCRSTRRRTRSR